MNIIDSGRVFQQQRFSKRAAALVTVFALVYALSSPILTALTAATSRRRLLMLALAAFGAANIVAALAPNYWALVAARVLLALSAGLYVPNANALASSLAAPHNRGWALGIVNGGITVAIAIGVPLGAFVGAHFGWRATFGGVALLSIVVCHHVETRMESSTSAMISAICAAK